MTSENIEIRMVPIGFRETRDEAISTGDAIGRVGTRSEEAGAKSEVGFGKMSTGLKGILGAVGFTGVAFGLKDLFEAGTRLQQQQAQLRSSLKSYGVTGEAAYKQVEDAATQSTEHGGFSRDVELQSISNFVRSTHNSTTAILANNAAVALSRGYGLNFQSVQRYIGQALVGNVRRLQQYSGNIANVTSHVDALKQAHKSALDQLEETAAVMGKSGSTWLKQQELLTSTTTAGYQAQYNAAVIEDKRATGLEVIRRVLQRSSGALDTYNNSTQGRLNNLKNTFEEVSGTIGEAFLPVINKVAGGLAAVVNWIGKTKGAAAALAIAVTVLSLYAMGKLFVEGLRDAVKWMVTWGSETEAVTAATGQATIGTFAQWDAIQQLNAALDGGRISQAQYAAGMQEIMAAEGEATVSSGILAGVLDAMWPIAVLVGVGIAVAEIIKHWKEVKAAAADVWTWITHHWELVGAIIEGPFGLAVAVIVTHFRQITSAAEGVVHWLIGAWKTLEGVLLWPFKELVKGVDWAWAEMKRMWSWIGHNPLTNLLGLSGKGSLLHGFGLLSSGGGVVPRHLATGGSPFSAPTGFGPSGTDTIPAYLSPGEVVLSNAMVQNITNNGGLGGGGRQQPIQVNIAPAPITLRMDSRTVAQGVVQYTLERGARGPGSLVGGALTTGATASSLGTGI